MCCSHFDCVNGDDLECPASSTQTTIHLNSYSIVTSHLARLKMTMSDVQRYVKELLEKQGGICALTAIPISCGHAGPLSATICSDELGRDILVAEFVALAKG